MGRDSPHGHDRSWANVLVDTSPQMYPGMESGAHSVSPGVEGNRGDTSTLSHLPLTCLQHKRDMLALQRRTWQTPPQPRAGDNSVPASQRRQRQDRTPPHDVLPEVHSLSPTTRTDGLQDCDLQECQGHDRQGRPKEPLRPKESGRPGKHGHRALNSILLSWSSWEWSLPTRWSQWWMSSALLWPRGRRWGSV